MYYQEMSSKVILWKRSSYSLRNERNKGANRKLDPKGTRSYTIISKINDNAYVVDIHLELGISTIVNVEDLTLFEESPPSKESDDMQEPKIE